MERAILFRGKVKYNGNHLFSGDWVYGSLIIKTNGIFIYVIDEDKFGNIVREFEVEVIPETVGEFTGLTDKNSVKVFSDDLLKDGKEDVFRVYQIAGGFCVKSSIWKKDIKEWDFSDILIAASLTDAQMQSYISESCEVIGNIHDKHVL